MNTLTSRPLYAYTAHGASPHYIRIGRTWTLCSRGVASIPVLQPVAPTDLCRSCVSVASHGAEYVTADPVEPEAQGICSGCGETHLLTDLGVLIEHKVERTKSGWVRCDGSDHAPQVTE